MKAHGTMSPTEPAPTRLLLVLPPGDTVMSSFQNGDPPRDLKDYLYSDEQTT